MRIIKTLILTGIILFGTTALFIVMMLILDIPHYKDWTEDDRRVYFLSYTIIMSTSILYCAVIDFFPNVKNNP